MILRSSAIPGSHRLSTVVLASYTTSSSIASMRARRAAFSVIRTSNIPAFRNALTSGLLTFASCGSVPSSHMSCSIPALSKEMSESYVARKWAGMWMRYVDNMRSAIAHINPSRSCVCGS